MKIENIIETWPIDEDKIITRSMIIAASNILINKFQSSGYDLANKREIEYANNILKQVPIKNEIILTLVLLLENMLVCFDKFYSNRNNLTEHEVNELDKLINELKNAVMSNKEYWLEVGSQK